MIKKSAHVLRAAPLPCMSGAESWEIPWLSRYSAPLMHGSLRPSTCAEEKVLRNKKAFGSQKGGGCEKISSQESDSGYLPEINQTLSIEAAQCALNLRGLWTIYPKPSETLKTFFISPDSWVDCTKSDSKRGTSASLKSFSLI